MAGALPPTPQINTQTSIWGFKYWFDKTQKWMRGAAATPQNPYTASFNVDQDNVYFLYPCDATSGAIVASLPSAAGNFGKKYVFKKVAGTNSVTVSAYSGDNIDGSSTFVLNTIEGAVELLSDGNKSWNVISQYPSGGSGGGGFVRTTGMNIPLAASFAGQMGTITSITNKSNRLQLTKVSAASNLAMLYVTPPSPPFTIDVCGTMLGFPITNDDVLIGIGRSDGTKIQTIWGGAAATNISNFPVAVQKWNTTAGTVTTSATGLVPLTPNSTFLRLTDNGTNCSYQYSGNGWDYYEVFTEARNTFLAATRIGICIYVSNQAAHADGKFAFYDFTVTPSILGDAS